METLDASDALAKSSARELTTPRTPLPAGFINQRKRHWHKLFPGGPPTTAEEAEAGMLETYGSLEAALIVAQRA